MHAHYLRGRIRLRKVENASALADFNEAIRLNPKEDTAWYQRGLTWNAQAKYEQALNDFNEAIRLNPENAENADAFRELALLRATCPDAKLQDRGLALKSASKACELTAWKNYDCLITLAEVQSCAGDFDPALKTIDKAIALLDAADERMQDCRQMQDSYRQKRPHH